MDASMKILYLPLKKEYYEMIERGEKLEEYRVKSPYWIARLFEWYYPIDGAILTRKITMQEARKIADEGLAAYRRSLRFRNFDATRFSYGYTRRRMLWECRGITEGIGRSEWGAPDYETFIIKLGTRL